METLSSKLGASAKKSFKNGVRLLKACTHEAVAWTAGDVAVFSTQPLAVVGANLVQLGCVTAASVAGEFSDGASAKAKKVKRFFTETVNPNLINAAFYSMNSAVALAEWTGTISRSVTSEESRMKFMLAALATAFFGAVGANNNPRFKDWLSRKGAVVNTLAKPEIYIAPQFPIFYALPLAKLGEKLGGVNVAGIQLPYLETGLCAIAAVTIANGFNNSRKGAAPGFCARNLGMISCLAANFGVMAQSYADGSVSPHILASTILFNAGNVVYLAKDRLFNRSKPTVG